MQIHLTQTGRIPMGTKNFFRVTTPRGVRVADYTSKAEAEARVVAEYRKRWGGDCSINFMTVGA